MLTVNWFLSRGALTQTSISLFSVIIYKVWQYLKLSLTRGIRRSSECTWGNHILISQLIITTAEYAIVNCQIRIHIRARNLLHLHEWGEERKFYIDQRANKYLEKLLEINSTWSVFIERTKDVFVEWSRLSLGEQGRIDWQEFLTA